MAIVARIFLCHALANTKTLRICLGNQTKNDHRAHKKTTEQCSLVVFQLILIASAIFINPKHFNDCLVALIFCLLDGFQKEKHTTKSQVLSCIGNLANLQN